ncbi:MAG TPA: phytoene desaturase family protein [Polyangiaceae bacterium LLY-WYZ-15_(1-7)]|nr:phytoene desaturase family protein [Polyangiaceae bacterium LLY-WYZ-15_(1-7)]HJL09637.1 phytoene desaturase family protein [Polyangiaceae bacterium LLY-WYZ-15_(1-7)]HJL32020.1 phytoene desaturase family protein [Polyangiaceae bacterium LLY-WYZ-15_(1-7)]HJL34220.1 phytoene desaturase family protein [Polyangiaceae bacterium LLY-WYZ-15_(1-7)]HJL48753.1 phytoene desaturase family protein [Polyangiaceae bacterium LLY-WYZ-15_(1-7)]
MIVVGAGVGGLACAIDLARSGCRVRVLEQRPQPGGKARVVRPGSLGVDAGPTVLTMAWVFDELFDAAGADFRAAVSLERAAVLARHAWPDGVRLDLFDDAARTRDAIGATFGAAEARAYDAFRAQTRRIYAISEPHFIRAQRLTLPGIVKRFGARGLATLASLDSHRTMWAALSKRFAEPKLRQLFGRYATYTGSSPFEAPATLNLVAHVESEGVYRAAGGIGAVVRAMTDLARSLGVEVLAGRPVERIVVERGRAVGVVSRGEHLPARAVVFNGDVSAIGGGLLGAEAARAVPPTPRALRSLSAITWAMEARPTGFPLLHHNVFFGPRYREEFEDIFDRGRAPEEPTVYVCAQDRGDEPGERGLERVLVIVCAPANGDRPERWGPAERERCTRAMEAALRRVGSTLAPEAQRVTTPVEFAALFPGTGGALYGPRSKGARSVLARRGAKTKLPGLYLAGGSVHPGAGVPMATLSGRLAAERIRADLVSTGRSPRAATTGTISTS